MFKEPIYKKLTVVVAALALLCLILTVVLIAVPAGEPSAPDSGDANKETPPKVENATLGETDDMGQSYLKKIVFLGDSNTAHLASRHYTKIAGMVDSSQIWTGDGDTLALSMSIDRTTIIDPEDDSASSLPALAAKYKPEYMVITVGYNSRNMDDEGFIRSYKKMVNAIKENSPSTKIILQSIFPVLAGDNVPDADSANARLNTLNGYILDIAEELGVKYLDTQSVLKDENGHLKAGYSKTGGFNHSDGYHLNDVGLLAVLNYIKTHAYN